MILITHDHGILTLQLNKPEKRNAIDEQMMKGMVDALTSACTDDGLRAIVLEGAGDHFCGGADIIARNDGDAKPRAGSIQRRLPVQAHRLIPLLLDVQIPVICKVRGWAAGIGFQLALASDFCIAAHDATFWQPFTERGFTPDSGATWLLPRRVGDVRARELLLLGRKLSGEDAAAWGAIHDAVAPAELDEAVNEIIERLAEGPTVALGLTKWLLRESADAPLDAQLRNEGFALELSSRSGDFREGLAAFQEKRPPRFEGR